MTVEFAQIVHELAYTPKFDSARPTNEKEEATGTGELRNTGVISHLVGFLQVLFPRALSRRELAAAIGAKATVAVFGSVELGQEHTSLSVEEPGRPLVLEDSGRLEQHQAAVTPQDDLEGAMEDGRPLPCD